MIGMNPKLRLWRGGGKKRGGDAQKSYQKRWRFCPAVSNSRRNQQSGLSLLGRLDPNGRFAGRLISVLRRLRAGDELLFPNRLVEE